MWLSEGEEKAAEGEAMRTYVWVRKSKKRKR